MGVSLAVSIGIPSLSRKRLTTRASSGPSPSRGKANYHLMSQVKYDLLPLYRRC